MTGRTPTTHEVERVYEHNREVHSPAEFPADEGTLDTDDAEFDRWLAARDAEVARKTLEDAADAMGKRSGLDQELVSPIDFLRARAASISTDKAGTGDGGA